MSIEAAGIEDAVRVMRSSNEERDNRRMALDLAVRLHTHSSRDINDEALVTTAEQLRKFLAGEV